MNFISFQAAIVLQRLGDLFGFSSENRKILHNKCYVDLELTTRRIDQFKKYLKAKEQQENQRIPREQLFEYFGVWHGTGVIMSGRDYNSHGIILGKMRP